MPETGGNGATSCRSLFSRGEASLFSVRPKKYLRKRSTSTVPFCQQSVNLLLRRLRLLGTYVFVGGGSCRQKLMYVASEETGSSVSRAAMRSRLRLISSWNHVHTSSCRSDTSSLCSIGSTRTSNRARRTPPNARGVETLLRSACRRFCIL